MFLNDAFVFRGEAMKEAVYPRLSGAGWLFGISEIFLKQIIRTTLNLLVRRRSGYII